MNRLISAVMAVLLAYAGSAAGGYWNPQGVVPVGDARVPAQLVGWLITIVSGVGGLAGGASVPWKTWLAALLAKLKSSGTVSVVNPAPNSPDGDAVPSKDLQRATVANVPIEVEHLQGCVYHLRRVLQDDQEAQDLLDQIAVKVGRATAGVKGGAA
jgi:uncharacterized protein YidB (DUF937 family)